MQRLQKDTLFAGRYLLIRQVGVGGFSEVWEAQDQEADGVTVAIKIYAPGKGLDDDGISLFRKEYAITLPINHPHLLKVQYFGVYEGSPYLIMPYCSNGSVGSLLNGGKTFNEEEAAVLLMQLSAALAYLHSRNPAIIHQDIKPDNVLIDEEGNFLLTDFGISSRMRHTMAKSTGKSSASMSIAYAPPERFSGTPRSLAAGDVFSLGVMLYELCTGDVPWMGNGGAALLKGAEIPNLPWQYSKRFNELVKSCMHLEPENRPDAGRLADLSARFRKEGFWDIVAPGEQKEVKRPAPARKARMAAVAVLLLVAALGSFAFYNWYGAPAERPSDPVVAGPANPASGREVIITVEDRLLKFKKFLSVGESLLAQKDYAAALMQFFIAEAFASPTDADLLRVRIEKCRKLARAKGVKAAEFIEIKKAIKKKAAVQAEREKQELIARKSTSSPGSPPVAATRTDSVVAVGNTSPEPPARTEPRINTAGLISQGEDLFKKRRFEQAFGLFSKAARADLPEGHYFTGLCYSTGSGVRRHPGKAKEHFEKAVAGGYALANYPLSVMYRTGKGVTANAHTADDYLTKALPVIISRAEKGEVVPQYYYGELLENGTRDGKDENKAAEWYRKAADQGYAPAQYALGKMYNEGRGAEQNYAAANEWLAKAARQEYRDAQFLLGYNLLFNHGRKDVGAGADLIAGAAGQEHPEAQYYLGVLFAFGQGAPQNKEAAKRWLQKAEANGYAKARNARQFLEGGFNQPVKVYDPATGDEMEVTVDYKDPFTSLGLLSDQNQHSQAGKLNFQIRYKLKSPYAYCQVKPEGPGFEFSGNYPALKEKEGVALPFIARETEGILNDKITLVMYYERTNEKNRKQKKELIKVDVPVFAVWL